MTVNWTRKALLRLSQIHDHIARENPLAAQSFVDHMTRKAQLVATQPHAGIMVKEYQRDEIREVYHGKYRLIYRVREQGIDVLTVRHGMRLMPKQIQSL